jgi:hypothetical protein
MMVPQMPVTAPAPRQRSTALELYAPRRATTSLSVPEVIWLQRTAGNLAVRELLNQTGQINLQRFAAQAFNIGGAPVGGTLSEGGKYFLPDGPLQSPYVFATTAPSWCQAVGAPVHFNGSNYHRYEPQDQFLDDCLHTAEEIVNGQILEIDTATYSKETVTGRVWGQSEGKNIEIAQKAKVKSVGSVDGAANAGIGNAFVIVDTEWISNPSERSPYHAGGVVGVDGNDRITMEVFASGGSRERRETPARLSMYTVGGGAASFHGYWSGSYFGRHETITIVIRAK